MEFGRVECPKTLPLSHGDREAQVTHNKSVRKRQCRGRTKNNILAANSSSPCVKRISLTHITIFHDTLKTKKKKRKEEEENNKIK